MLRILVEQAGEVIDDALFDKKVVSVGRDLGNDVVLRDPRVSSLHLVIKQVGETPRFRLIDQGWNATEMDAGISEGSGIVERPTVIQVAGYELTLIPLEGHERTSGIGRSDFERTVEHEQIPSRSSPEAPSSRAEAEFVIVDETGFERHVQFCETALIGRTSDCDVRLDSSDVSRQHCQVYNSSSGYLLRRLSSVNGVDVNGRALALGESCPLRNGDVVTICNFRLSFRASAKNASLQIVDSSPNFDLSIQRRQSIAPEAMTFEVVGFLGSKTFSKFEQEVLKSIRQHRDVILDLGYLVGLDAAGLTSLARVFGEASRYRTVVRLIRCSPRVVDLIHASTLSREILPYVSRSEESAVKLLRR